MANPNRQTRYALKQRGSIKPTPRTKRVWCGACYCRNCICSVHRKEYEEREAKREARRAEIEAAEVYNPVYAFD